jgi:hypothetical protein
VKGTRETSTERHHRPAAVSERSEGRKQERQRQATVIFSRQSQVISRELSEVGVAPGEHRLRRRHSAINDQPSMINPVHLSRSLASSSSVTRARHTATASKGAGGRGRRPVSPVPLATAVFVPGQSRTGRVRQGQHETPCRLRDTADPQREVPSHGASLGADGDFDVRFCKGRAFGASPRRSDRDLALSGCRKWSRGRNPKRLSGVHCPAL